MFLSFCGKFPRDEGAVFVAPNATVQGDVVLRPGSTVWYGAVLRGDDGTLTIGENTNVQDNAVLHCDVGGAVTLGKNVTVGHSALVHGCTVGDGSLIGMHATLLNHCVVGKNCIIGAGALVPEGMVIPDGSVAVGVPAKIIKQVTPAQAEASVRNAAHYAGQIQGCPCEPYITPADCDRILVTRKPTPRRSGRPYLFSGMIFCAECSGRMGAHQHFYKRKTGMVMWNKVDKTDGTKLLGGSEWTLTRTKNFSWVNGKASYTEANEELAIITDCVDSSETQCAASTDAYADIDGLQVQNHGPGMRRIQARREKGTCRVRS